MSLKMLIPLKFPEDTADFGGRLKGRHIWRSIELTILVAMQKLDIFANIGEILHEMCMVKFEMQDPSLYALATLEGVRLHEDRKLIHYGLGCRFSSWELRVVRKTELPLPPLLRIAELTWMIIPAAPINRVELAAIITELDERITSTENELVCVCNCAGVAQFLCRILRERKSLISRSRTSPISI